MAKTEYNRRFSTLTLYFGVMNGFIAVFFILSHLKLDLLALGVIGVVDIYFVFSAIRKPYQITIDKEKSTVEIKYVLEMLQKTRLLSLQETSCSFNKEVRARGNKIKTLKIVRDDKVITELLPGISGWDEETLKRIFENMNDGRSRNSVE